MNVRLLGDGRRWMAANPVIQGRDSSADCVIHVQLGRLPFAPPGFCSVAAFRAAAALLIQH